MLRIICNEKTDMEKTKLGATGEFPEGKLNENDEGAIQMVIFVRDENVIINFGSPVNWLGLPKSDAIVFAEAILRKVKEID
jgi:hypothetical protein